MQTKDILIYHSAGNLYWKDKDFKYLGCNENFLKIAKLSSSAEIIGKTDRELFYKYLGEEGIQNLLNVDK
jgi:two-component system, OmpR family, aerobic respiration control sensor histidine kinase ArcB